MTSDQHGGQLPSREELAKVICSRVRDPHGLSSWDKEDKITQLLCLAIADAVLAHLAQRGEQPQERLTATIEKPDGEPLDIYSATVDAETLAFLKASEGCTRCQKRIADLEQQLSTANADTQTLRGMLRDATGQREEADVLILVDKLVVKCIAANAAREAAEAGAIAFRDVVRDAVNGGCVWKRGGDMVAAEDLLDEHANPGQFLLAELASLRSEVERLTKERDEAKGDLAEQKEKSDEFRRLVKEFVYLLRSECFINSAINPQEGHDGAYKALQRLRKVLRGLAGAFYPLRTHLYSSTHFLPDARWQRPSVGMLWLRT